MVNQTKINRQQGHDGAEHTAPAPTEQPLAGRTAWIITDGRIGIEVPCVSVAKALGAEPVLKRIAPGLPWSWLAPWGPPDPSYRIGRESSPFAPPYPELAIASGRQSVPFVRAIRRASGGGTFSVFLQDPRRNPGVVDLVCAPEHDRIHGPNVFKTLTAPSSLPADRLEALRSEPPQDIAALPRPRVAVILGGTNAVYHFGNQSLRRLARALHSLVELGVSLMITPSRRTPTKLLKTAVEASGGAPRELWNGKGGNPYHQFLANADAILVTADSVNMVSEACATGRPVYVFEPEGGSAKFNRFHDELRRLGATRPAPERFMQLDDWSYTPIDSTPAIAAEIERRWLARQTSA